MSRNWQGKTIVVTGGSSGLGRAIAEEFAQRGARLVLLARNASRLQHARASIEQGGDARAKVLTVTADVSVAEDVTRAFAQIQRDCSSIDVLVNAAGISARSAILDATEADFQLLWDLNFLGVVRCTRAASERLLQARGHVVNIGSLASKIASRYLGAYPASKFAVAAYSQQLRLELGPLGLHVLLVCPGPLARDDAGRRYDSQATGLPETARQPGGGARLKRIDPRWLARRIVSACDRRKAELIVPGTARWLFALAQLSPALGDWVVRRKT